MRFENALNLFWIALTPEQYANVTFDDICNDIDSIKANIPIVY